MFSYLTFLLKVLAWGPHSANLIKPTEEHKMLSLLLQQYTFHDLENARNMVKPNFQLVELIGA